MNKYTHQQLQQFVEALCDSQQPNSNEFVKLRNARSYTAAEKKLITASYEKLIQYDAKK